MRLLQEEIERRRLGRWLLGLVAGGACMGWMALTVIVAAEDGYVWVASLAVLIGALAMLKTISLYRRFTRPG